MSSQSSQIIQIRQQRHRDYLLKTWYPTFIQKWGANKSMDRTKVNEIICNYFKNKLLYIDNLTHDELKGIPGLYRYRTIVTSENGPVDEKECLGNDDDDPELKHALDLSKHSNFDDPELKHALDLSKH